jgi:radical SAM-linked protein
LAYSHGYTPRPQLNLAAPLPLGFLSNGEIGDFWLEESYPLDTIERKLQKATPPGIRIHHLEEVPDIHGDKLPNLVNTATYAVSLFENVKSLKDRVQKIIQEENIIRERKGKTYDLRPLIQELKALPPGEDSRQRLEMNLTLLPGATGRPDEVIKEMGIDPYQAQICRKEIHLVASYKRS